MSGGQPNIKNKIKTNMNQTWKTKSCLVEGMVCLIGIKQKRSILLIKGTLVKYIILRRDPSNLLYFVN